MAATRQAAGQTAQSDAASSRLVYDRPASDWTKALAIGNVRFGAMVFGGEADVRLQLKGLDVWLVGPTLDADKHDAYRSLLEIRRLLCDGHIPEAQK